jgi:aminoglycoside 6'-N-acetyltransferase I
VEGRGADRPGAGIGAFPDLTPDQRERCAVILVEALRHMPSAWPDLASAREEVGSFLAGRDRLGWAAVEPEGGVLGWIGCILDSPHAAELHPLVVEPRRQRTGIGTRLVRRLEAELRRRGVGTV